MQVTGTSVERSKFRAQPQLVEACDRLAHQRLSGALSF
jgi:hypothetical protein